MKIKWLGHAAFLITAADGTKILTDPYKPTNELRYGEIKESADIVTVSHNHWDHNNTSAVKGNPKIVKASASVKGITFRAIPVFHDEAEGRQRGTNTIFCFTVDDIAICHLGDLGHLLHDKQKAEVGTVDILLFPAGGLYTINGAAASKIITDLKPRLSIPMHFKTSKTTMPISGLEELSRHRTDIVQADSSEVEFTRESLPTKLQVLVLKPAL